MYDLVYIIPLFLFSSTSTLAPLVLYATILDHFILYLGINIYIDLQFHHAKLRHGPYDLLFSYKPSYFLVGP